MKLLERSGRRSEKISSAQWRARSWGEGLGVEDRDLEWKSLASSGTELYSIFYLFARLLEDKSNFPRSVTVTREVGKAEFRGTYCILVGPDFVLGIVKLFASLLTQGVAVSRLVRRGQIGQGQSLQLDSKAVMGVFIRQSRQRSLINPEPFSRVATQCYLRA